MPALRRPVLILSRKRKVIAMKCWMKKAILLTLGLAVFLAVKPVDTIRSNARALLSSASYISQLFISDRIKGGPDATAAVLLDLSTGKMLVSINADAPLPPASMSKMMTEYLVLEHIADGNLDWDELVPISSYAASVIGSKAHFRAGDEVTVRDLFAALAVQSANDAAIVLAEKIAGTEEKFAVLMNRKAEQLGLSPRSRFINATGLSRRDMGEHAPSLLKGEQTLTARDTATLAARLLDDHPEVLEYSYLPRYTMQYRNQVVNSTNLMLREEYRSTLYVAGMDGLKTGFTDEAGYCFTGTAVLGGKRYISVIMGASTSVKRFEETKKLLSYGASAEENPSHELSLGL